VDVVSLVIPRFPLEEAPAALRMHAENAPGAVKSLIVPNQERRKLR
jgi:L-iditol 2-dehydrogenase